MCLSGLPAPAATKYKLHPKGTKRSDVFPEGGVKKEEDEDLEEDKQPEIQVHFMYIHLSLIID